MASITDPLELPNGQRFANRLVKAAMTEGLADRNGVPTSQLVQLYRRWSDANLGMLLTGNVQVDRMHLERAGNPIVAGELSDQARARFAEWATAAASQGARVWAQLSHAGRQTPLNINRQPKAPSAVALDVPKVMEFGAPVAMTEADIEGVAQTFVTAAKELEKSGFDGVQIHAAHGYLLSAFLSPLANRRTDQYGGPIENRARLLLRIVRDIRSACGDAFGLGVKMNSADFQRGGFDVDDSEIVAGWLDEAGVDLVEVSGGNYENPQMVGVGEVQSEAQASTIRREAYFLEFTPRIREKLQRAKLMVTGGFRSTGVMNDALERDGVDLIGIGRPLCGAPACTAYLLAGEINVLPRFEDRLRLGPGILSPRSPFGLIKTINTGGAQAWYYQQLVRIGDGQEPDSRYGIFKPLLAHRKRDEALAREIST